MKILVTGATGYVGYSVATALRREGHTVTGLTRDASSARSRTLTAAEVHPSEAQMADPDSFRQVLDDADAVVHTVFDMNDPVGTDRKLFEALAAAQSRTGRSRHLVYTTGISHYGRTGLGLHDEETRPNPDGPLYFRMEQEAELAATGLPYTILRPGFVFGGSSLTSIADAWWTGAEAGRVIFYGDRTKRWTWIHVEDLAAAYVAVLARTGAVDGQVFLIGDDREQYVTLDVLKTCLAAADYTGEITYESAEAGGPLHMAADQDELVTSAKARRTLGWAPRHASLPEDAARYYRAWLARRSV